MKNFEEYVGKVWDNVMPSSAGWDRWEEDAAYNVDIMRFAKEIAREAFADGARFGANYPHGTCGDMMVAMDRPLIRVAMDKRYPLPNGPRAFPHSKHDWRVPCQHQPEVKYRTAGPDTNGNRWQVRDGITWISHNYKPFHRHIEVSEVLNALTSLGEYHNVAIVAELAANPTED